MKRAAVGLAVAVAACSPPPPAAVTVDVRCRPEGRPLRQHCTVVLAERGSGRPVGGARVTLSADMPSMPLAHHVRPVTAEPAGVPGAYQGTLELEMPGRWVVQVRIAGPVRDQATHTLEVPER